MIIIQLVMCVDQFRFKMYGTSIGYLTTSKKDLDKLSEKWEDEEKLKKKVEEFRCKEVKNILFEPYIKMVKQNLIKRIARKKIKA